MRELLLLGSHLSSDLSRENFFDKTQHQKCVCLQSSEGVYATKLKTKKGGKRKEGSKEGQPKEREPRGRVRGRQTAGKTEQRRAKARNNRKRFKLRVRSQEETNKAS